MTHLTPAQREQLRVAVQSEVERAARRAAELQRSFDDIVASSAEAVRDDEHDPEGATIAFERAQVAALRSDAEDLLAALARADERFATDDAGRCEMCGGPIAFERLLARPAATRCVVCAAV